MKKFLNNKLLKVSAAVTAGLMLGSQDAYAQQDVSTITDNIVTSIGNVPSLLTGVSYMLGILLGVLGILKIKDHVENPSQTPLQHGAIRLMAGGGLFALPIVYEAMQTSIGTGTGPAAIGVNAVGTSYTIN